MRGLGQELDRVFMTRSGGPVFEKAFDEGLALFCKGAGWEYLSMPGTKNDKWHGTDAALLSHLEEITANAGPLRLDFTHAFSHKDNMPLLWEPTPTKAVYAGQKLRYGIRIANASRGFPDPVIVVGIDADRYDVNCSDAQIRSAAKNNAEAILFEAGEALSAFTLLADNGYYDYLAAVADYEDHETDSGIYLPDTSRLSVNPEYGPGQAGFTHRPNGLCHAAINAASKLSVEGMCGSDPAKAMADAQRLAKAMDAIIPKPSKSPREIMAEKIKRLRENNVPAPDRDEPSY